MATLWSILAPVIRREKPEPKRTSRVTRKPNRTQNSPKPLTRAAVGSDPTDLEAKLLAATRMTDRYILIEALMLARYNVRVRKWRSSMSGVAWETRWPDGTTANRLIEAPRPRGPMSAAVFLHEIGHHAIGVGSVSPRCLEEMEAWRFATDTMTRYNLNLSQKVKDRVRWSLDYAVAKARRRNIRHVPPEIAAYLRTLDQTP